MSHAGVGPLSSLILGVILSSLITVLLVLAGAAVIGEPSAIGKEPSQSCVAFQVGSPRAANTHIHLENRGQDSISVQFDFVNDTGLNSWADRYSRSIEPWASDEVVFRTPALGTAVKLISPGSSLHAMTEIVHDDEALPEIRKAIPCIARNATTSGARA